MAALGVPAKAIAGDPGREAHQSLNSKGVAKAAGRQQPGARAGALNDRVGRLRCAMPERGDLCEQLLSGHALLLGSVLDGVEHANFEFAGR